MGEQALRQDCWNSIGVWGDRKCPELEKYAHCHNCPVYGKAAEEILNGPHPPHYLDEWKRVVARKREDKDAVTHSAIVFRVEGEWLALSTSVFQEVAPCKGIHSLPHLRGDMILGLVNVRGQLLICLSLSRVLGLEGTPADEQRRAASSRQLLVIEEGQKRLTFPADEVGGIHEFASSDVKPVPATFHGAVAIHTNGLLDWRNHAVGHLDERRLFLTLNERLA